jgi:hypothetical protein
MTDWTTSASDAEDILARIHDEAIASGVGGGAEIELLRAEIRRLCAVLARLAHPTYRPCWDEATLLQDEVTQIARDALDWTP